MPKRFLENINTYKELCDELIVGCSDIIDLAESDALHPLAALAQMRYKRIRNGVHRLLSNLLHVR